MVPQVVHSRRVVILLMVTALALLTLDTREFGPFRAVRSTTVSITSPVQGFLGALVSPIGAAWTGAFGVDELELENAELRNRVAALEAQLEQAPNVAAELDELRIATSIDFVGQYETVAARVVADRRTPLERLLELDRGSDDGIAVGQPVVTGAGLVGQVVQTTGGRSVIRLVTDPRLAIGVTTPASGAVGVARGEGERRRLSVDLVEQDRRSVQVGDQFVTSGFEEGAFPAAIPVGQYRLDEGGTSTLVPAADLDHLGFVSIVMTGESE